MREEKVQQKSFISLYKIQNFEEVCETIRIAFFKVKEKQLRKNGLPALLSGMRVGSVKQVMLDALKEGGSGLDKETCLVITTAINKLMIELNFPNLQIEEDKIIPIY